MGPRLQFRVTPRINIAYAGEPWMSHRWRSWSRQPGGVRSQERRLMDAKSWSSGFPAVRARLAEATGFAPGRRLAGPSGVERPDVVQRGLTTDQARATRRTLSVGIGSPTSARRSGELPAAAASIRRSS